MIYNLSKQYPIDRICKLFNVKRDGYYKWIKRGIPRYTRVNVSDLKIIKDAHTFNKATYGTHRLVAYIEKKEKIKFNHKKVRRYKNLFNIITATRKRNPLKIKAQQWLKENNAPNRLDGDFSTLRPLEKLSTDVSYIQCKDGTLYLSAIKDLYNNEIIAWNLSNKNDGRLVMDTIKKLKPGFGIIHSDQGSLYSMHEYVKKIESLGYVRSMSAKGCCWQNSPIENWFSQLKEECIRNGSKMTKAETILAIKKYIRWYNNERIQKDLGYLSPVQYSNI